MAATTGFKVQCPSCEASVTIKNASLIGKKVDCPKCKYRFVVEAPEDEEAVGGQARKGGQAGGTAVAKKAPGKSRSRRRRGPEGKKKSNTILFVGIGIVVLTISVVAAAFFGGLFDGEEQKTSNNNPAPKTKGTSGGGTSDGGGGGGNTDGDGNTSPVAKSNSGGGPGIGRDVTNLLPNDTQWVLDVNVVAMLGAAGAALFDSAKGTGALVRDYLGLSHGEIDRVVASGGGDGAWTFSLVRARNSFNLDAIKQAMELGDPLGEIKRRDYYLTKDNALFQAVGNFFATRSRTWAGSWSPARPPPS